MGTWAELGAQGLEQPSVAEPAVGDHQDRGLGEHLGHRPDHPYRLGELGLKDQRLATDADAPRVQRLVAQIKGEGQGQAAPAPMDHLQQAHRHQRLCPRVLTLIDLGRVVEAALTGEHLAPTLGVDGIVQRHQQTSVGQRVRDRTPEHLPTPHPGQLHRRHEGVVARLGDRHTEQGGNGPQQVRGARGGDRHQDRLQGKDEPAPPLLAVARRRKQGLELARQSG